MPTFSKRTEIPVPAIELDRWHARSGAFERLAPPWQRVEILETANSLEPGSRVVVRIGTPPLTMRWSALHTKREPGRRFVDVQTSGPFARWEHEHLFEDLGPGLCALHDRIDYDLPFRALGDAVGGRLVRRRLESMFRRRHEVTRSDLLRHAPYFGDRPQKVAVTGSSGLVGRALCAFLSTGGHEVLRFVRARPAGRGEIAWDPENGIIEGGKLEGTDAVVHLAGENIASSRWSDTRKAAILGSRERGTGLIAKTLASSARMPRLLLSASAVGYYGPRDDTPIDENGPSGAGFLAEVCRAWEAATEPAARAGVRTVRMRFGVILTPAGGALAKMLLPFRLGAGGTIGTGRQGFPWIALDDAVYAIHHLLRSQGASGAVNVAAPGLVSQREFARTLGRVLRRPAVAPLPAFVVRALFGQMGEEALLSGQFVEPAALRRSGFSWSAPKLEDALRGLLGRSR